MTTQRDLKRRIGELSLPPSFDGLLIWGHLFNRPFLRCLHGYALCRWRLGDLAEAQRVFERLLSLNPNDNQGVRFCWEDVLKGRSWDEATRRGPWSSARPRGPVPQTARGSVAECQTQAPTELGGSSIVQ
jgi:hypothetical protein